jgi:hypothetical protein
LVQRIFKSIEWPNEWRGRRPPFIGPIGNLLVGVSEIRTCPTKRPNMFGKGY